jgi:hypothetical protein
MSDSKGGARAGELTPAARKRAASWKEEPIRFAGATLGHTRHICAFFNTPEEEYRVLLPFIKDGFERGDKAFHVVNPELRDDHLERLGSVGIDTDEAQQEWQLELCDWNEAYFPDGRFDQDRMLSMWQSVLDDAEEMGFPRTRIVAHMEWALEDRDGANDLLEYEARYNLVDHKNDPVVCTYDLTKFSADVIVDVMRTHPMIIIGGILQENPFFIPPEEFIRELGQRKTEAAAGT